LIIEDQFGGKSRRTRTNKEHGPDKAAVAGHLGVDRREGGDVLGLALASGICGLLLGRYFNVYACFPTTLVLIVAAYSVGKAEGLAAGILAVVFSVTAKQICFLVGAAIQAQGEDLAPTTTASRTKAPSEDYM
jgi:hypothetical protein